MALKTSPRQAPACCPPKTSLEERPPLSRNKGGELEGFFKTLGNRTRLQMLHALIRRGELCVTELAREVGMKPQAVSNQLQKLQSRGILASERNGNNIHYRIVDPCVMGLLDLGLCLLEDSTERRKWEARLVSRKRRVSSHG